MRTAIFDLETFTLTADTGILLCASIKEYGRAGPIKTIRADEFPGWKRNRANSRAVFESGAIELVP